MKDDAERLVRELGELIELVREAADNAEAKQRHEQLLAIGRTVEELERKGIPVPDDLRRLKTELAAGLSQYEETSETLAYLKAHLPSLLEPLGLSLRQTRGRSRTREAQGRPPSGDATPMAVLRSWIVEALAALGGSGSPSEIRRWIEKEHEQDLLPGDREHTLDGAVRLVTRLSWQGYNMRQRGALKSTSDSPRGIWELPDEG